MKTTIKYIDSNFYQITDKAAGAIAKYVGKKLPKRGNSLACSVQSIADGEIFQLQRTPISATKRGWVWAIHNPQLWAHYLRQSKITILSV